MSPIPVVPHHVTSATPDQLRRADRLAARLTAEQPILAADSWVRRLMPERLDEGPALHLDDLAEIPLLDRFYDVSFLEDRARFRAVTGDVVATCTPTDDAFAHYCEEELDLGTVRWLRPVGSESSLGVATACWTDREVRRTLVRLLRTGGLRYLHPHLGSFRIWALAELLRRASGRPLHVIAPPPALTQRVNDKVWFADTVARLFGKRMVPPTAHAWNYSTLARVVRAFARKARTIVIKVPDSAGGAGNLLLAARRYRRRSLGQVRLRLRERLRPIGWRGMHPLLVSCWERNVLCAPSVQLWIPPNASGEPPVVEGLFEQLLEGEEGMFIGARPARLPLTLTEELTGRSALVARVFQRLGYVGRCSFDLLVVGPDLGRCRVEFVECNGRWGGTSIPMTLMNRLFGDHRRRPYTTREIDLPGLDRFSFADLLQVFADELYDARTGTGRIVLYNPGALRTRPGLDALAMGDTWAEVERLAFTEIPARLLSLVRSPQPV